MVNKVDNLTELVSKGADHEARIDDLKCWEAAREYQRRDEYFEAVIIDLRDKLDRATIRQAIHVQQQVQHDIDMNAEHYNHRLEMSQENNQDKSAQLEHALQECAEYGRQEVRRKEDRRQRRSYCTDLQA